MEGMFMGEAMQFFLSCASAVFSGAIAYFGWWLKKRDGERQEAETARQREYEAIRKGMRAMLRDRIIQIYNNCSERGDTPIYAIQNVANMYQAYHDLGGNGAITEVYNKFIHLPQTGTKKEGEDR